MKLRQKFQFLFKGLSKNVFLLGLLSFFNDVSGEMVSPLLPLYLTSLGLGAGFLGILEGVADFLSYLMMLLMGVYSDRYGKHVGLTLWGYRLCAWIRLLLAIPNPATVLSARWIDRLGKGIRTPPRDRLITASTESKVWGKAFGLQRALDHAGGIFGALIAVIFLAKLSESSLPYLFLIGAVPAILSITFLSSQIKKLHFKVPLRTSTLPWKSFPKKIRPFVLVIFLSSLSNPSELFLMMRATDLGLEKYKIPLLWIFMALFKLISSFLGGVLADHWSRRKTIGLSWLLFSLAFIGFALNTQLIFVWPLVALYGFHSGLMEASQRAYPATLAREEERASALGWYYFAYGVGTLPASAIFGLIWKYWGSSTAFSIYAASMVLTVPWLFWLPSDRPLKRKSS